MVNIRSARELARLNTLYQASGGGTREKLIRTRSKLHSHEIRGTRLRRITATKYVAMKFDRNAIKHYSHEIRGNPRQWRSGIRMEL